MSAKCQYIGWEGDKVKDMLDEVEEKSSGLWPAIETLKHRYRKRGEIVVTCSEMNRHPILLLHTVVHLDLNR